MQITVGVAGGAGPAETAIAPPCMAYLGMGFSEQRLQSRPAWRRACDYWALHTLRPAGEAGAAGISLAPVRARSTFKPDQRDLEIAWPRAACSSA